MTEIIPGYSLEQKVSIVSADETTINTEITTQSGDGWLVVSIILSGADVIILFQRTIAS